jgi:hypothetical protein
MTDLIPGPALTAEDFDRLRESAHRVVRSRANFATSHNFYPGLEAESTEVDRAMRFVADVGGGIHYSTDRFLFFGSSGDWAIWGDREWELAVLWSTSSEKVWRDRGVEFVDAEQAVEIVEDAFWHAPTPNAEIALFLSAFSRGPGS